MTKHKECVSRNKTIIVAVYVFILMFNVFTAKAQLPIVRINTTNQLSENFCDCHFSLDDKITLYADIRFRGASSMSKQKKSFAIKLKDSSGERCDTSLLGMRKDNYWILDAMANDLARMRNRISMDLWNDFSRKPYIIQKEENSRNGTDGKFVELYLNDEYWGVYCLSERLDRKQLKLKKFNENTVKGILYKSVSWSTLSSTDKNYYNYDNKRNTWNGWEISYPNLDDDEPIDWQPLADIIQWFSYSDTFQIKEHLTSKIDAPVWQDYFLLVEFICAKDNICKNQYVYFYNVTKEDRKQGIAPWDMDLSWGRDYQGMKIYNTIANYDMVTTSNKVSKMLYDNEELLEKSFKDRYAELRTTFFDSENLKNRFRTYFKLFAESGAAERERERWSGVDGIDLDFEAEQNYIFKWIDNRLSYLDKKYNYNAASTSIPKQLIDNHVDNIYDTSGRYIRNFRPDVQTIYIKSGRKYIKKESLLIKGDK